eukprot:scaffold44405_cov18-Tisochrysis_lutea.AAC.1
MPFSAQGRLPGRLQCQLPRKDHLPQVPQARVHAQRLGPCARRAQLRPARCALGAAVHLWLP